MNINSLVINGLSSLNLPVSPDVYIGTSEEYITFNYSDERPALYADDTDTDDETIIQVHHFKKGNSQTTKKAIRSLLRASGFTIISTSQFYENDTGYTHVVVEAWIDGAD